MLQTDTSQVSYQGNGSTSTPYPVSFLFFANSDLVVTVTTAAGVKTTLGPGDYSVTGAANPSGGNVTTAIAYDSTNTLIITREVSVTQLTSYVENDKFPAASHERALDKLTMICQQLSRDAKDPFANLPNSNPHILGAAYRSGDFVAISNG